MSDFELITGMQVVRVNKTKRGTNEEFTIATFCEDNGWIETQCSAEHLDIEKAHQLNKVTNKDYA